MVTFLIFILLSGASSFTLTAPSLAVELDDAFPRPLSYTLASTGETLSGALLGPGFHLSLSLNKGQVTCGEAAISTVYTPLQAPAGQALAAFSTTAFCALNWAQPPAARGARAGAPPALLTLQLNGSVAAYPDAAAPGASAFALQLQALALTGGAAPAVSTLDVVGLELLSFRPPRNVTPCMYTPTMAGAPTPRCAADFYFVDSWKNSALDEWYTGTWAQSWVIGQADVNTPADGAAGCMDGALSRHSAGPLLSVFAGGWSATARTGAAALSSEKHAPFWTGLRSHDAPGRCSVFTVAPATLHPAYVCGAGLPIALTVGVFPDLTQDGAVGGDDIALWRRAQYPRADLLYRTTLPYKIQVDLRSYNPGWGVIPFEDVLGYVANISRVTDAYPQTPILVGWQGLGHDTLYPAWDALNIRPEVGGAAGLAALAAGLQGASRSNRTSLSYHVNSDEAYELFDGAPNAEFQAGAMRLNVDHATPWCMAGNVTGQTPNPGRRCSISKAKDAAAHGRYARYARMFGVVPGGLRTIHSDAWRDVGASWEPEGLLDWANEQRCGQQGDAAFWAAHGSGVSMGVEGNDGQAAELMGTVSFLYHSGAGWDPVSWGRLVAGTALGWDLDV